MSAMASPAPSESETKRGEVTYRFCQEWSVLPLCSRMNSLLMIRSSNLLYPKEDRATSTLLFECKACMAKVQHDNACTYRHHLGSTVTETAGVTTDVANDPTVGEQSLQVPSFCTMCGNELKCVTCGELATEDPENSELSAL